MLVGVTTDWAAAGLGAKMDWIVGKTIAAQGHAARQLEKLPPRTGCVARLAPPPRFFGRE